MAIHIASNGISWILTGVDILVTGSDAKPTLADFQSYWWVGLIAVVIVTPWVVKFVKRNTPLRSWRVPYLALQETAQETEIPAEKYLAHAS